MLTYQYTFGFEDFCENIYKQLTSFFWEYSIEISVRI